MRRMRRRRMRRRWRRRTRRRRRRRRRRRVKQSHYRPEQAEDSRKLRLPDFKTIGT